MPIDIDIRPDENLRITRFTGVVTDEELTAFVHRLREGFDPNMNGLVDAQASDLQISAQGLRAISEAMQTPPTAGERRVAILAGDDLAFGFGRMYEAIHRSPAQVQVFRDRDEAMSWLSGREADHDLG